MKSINFVLIALAAVAVSAGTAFASVNISGGNDTTGCDSSNLNNWEIANGGEIVVDNFARANNDYNVGIETGNNIFGPNTCLGGVLTGSVVGDVAFVNRLNDADINLALPVWNDNICVTLANALTGPGSYNENNVVIDNSRFINIENTARINNDVNFLANTGNNDISCNTSVGCVQTGSVAFAADVTNIANTAGCGNFVGVLPVSAVGVSLGNELTGPCSENLNNVAIDNSATVSIVNEACINNDFNIDANTGNNFVGNNTVVGNVRTGDVSISVTAVNQAN